ncbi:hypothetical protein AJ80_07283 [Polytolypa hystricis UAMH7299]|uniref:DUF7580 domain-containing protein n=1 Tax=Polytolypa hystricis (strain UAMH7299) TaxID=1447883 RepID=A0A2B7XQ49_POLH7|nr:hypothetical protein AJ80_07283 [Polytolypa hystricis UAMH7299]
MAMEIASLTIAVFDQLLRLGEKTAKLVSDIRAFDEDVGSLKLRIQDENNRTKQLKALLFEHSPTYGDVSLFEHLNEDVQDQIQILLLQAVAKLQEALDLLHRRHIIEDEKPCTLSPSSPPNNGLSIFANLRLSTRSPIRLLRWSLRDKARTQTLLTEFTELNGRVHENIKLFLLSSNLARNINQQLHLQHLQTDPASVNLGFNVDAALRILANGPPCHAATDDLEIEDGYRIDSLTTNIVTLNERFGVTSFHDRSYITEFRRYDPGHDPTCVNGKEQAIDPRTKSLLNGLTRLLRQPKEQVFLIRGCEGWRYLPDRERVMFVFDIPQGCESTPISLLDLLRNPKAKPSLNEKLQMAFGLARCISQLQMVRWVHESFRSENILFFPQRPDPVEPIEREERVNYSEPWVFGFEFSRPEGFFSHGLTDVCLERDVYRHPDRQGRPNVLFSKVHDIYALGVVLLEIGLWEPWDKLQKVENAWRKDAWSLQALLVQHAQRFLGRRMGEKYKSIVVKCLSGHFAVVDDTREDLKLQQTFRAEVVDVLERAMGSI